MNPFGLVGERSKAYYVAATGMMTALVFVLTSIFQISIVATKGYFNVGEIGVYISALLFGPYVGAFAGGVGSALADIATGYSVYAPGTLIIKGCEGYLAGILLQRFQGKAKKILPVVLGLVVALCIGVIGVLYYNSVWDFVLGVYINPSGGETPLLDISFLRVSISLNSIFWIIIAIISGVTIAYIGTMVSPDISSLVLAVLIAGGTMVLGYFLYEYFILYAILGMEVVAVVEVPFNIGQAVVGLIISIPIVRTLKKVFE